MACAHDSRTARGTAAPAGRRRARPPARRRRIAVALAALFLASCGDGPPPTKPEPHAAPVWVSVTPETVGLTYFGERVRLRATVRPNPPGTRVGWSSTDAAVVTVDADGVVTAVSNGTAGVVAEVGPLRDTALVEMRQRAVRLEVVAGAGQRWMAGQPLRERVGVRVLDEGGSLFVRHQGIVNYDASAQGGRVDPEEAWAGEDNIAWTEWTLGAVVGPQTLVARTMQGSAVVGSTEIGAVALHPDSVVAAVAVHSGEGQGALRGQTLGEPVVVGVVDSLGRRVPGATVRFEPAAGHGSADPAETVSGRLGLAATEWTLGPALGPQRLVVSVLHGPATAEIGAVALHPDSAVAALAVHSGDGQEALQGQTLGEPLVVVVHDSLGRPIPGATVRFKPAVGHGSADPAETVSGRLGLAATEWTLGPGPGPQMLLVTVLHGPATAEIGAVARQHPDSAVVALAMYSGEGQGALAGEALEDPVVVGVVDSRGRPIPGATIRFEPAAGHGSADPAEVVSDSLGLAATRWTLGEEPGPQTLVVRAALGAALEIGATAQSREGVCARTPAVAEEIVREAGAASCAEVTEEDLAGIDSLNLAERGIRRLRSGDFAGLAGMTRLYLDRNRLAELPPDIFEGLANLVRLQMYDNELSELPAGVFGGLGRLRFLWLSGNRLSGLPPGIFAGNPALRSLHLTNNRLAGLPPRVFAGLGELRYLHLGENAVEELPPGVFDGLARLVGLRLDHLQLAELPPGVFADFESLRWLYLNHNRFRELPPGIFDGLTSLQILDLSRNGYLRGLPPGIFDDLESLLVLELRTGNRLGELRPGVFSRLGNLWELDIGHNFLAALPPGVFAGLANLRTLRLDYNNLVELPPRVFVGLHAIEEVGAHLNPTSQPRPFPVRIELERTDTGDVLAPGPARVVMRVPDGAPYPLRVPVVVQGGTASAAWLEAGPGDTVSAPLVASRPAGSGGPVHLGFGQAPPPPRKFRGLGVVPDGELVLFEASDNRSPVLAKEMPLHWLQAGGEAVELALGPHFTDPDGDSLVYTAATEDGRVAGASVSGGVLWIEPRAEGETAVVVGALDPGGLRASQRVKVAVAPAPDPDRFDIHLLFVGDFPKAHRAGVRRAADRWEEVVVGDLLDVPFHYRTADGSLKFAATVDDLLIINGYHGGAGLLAYVRGCAVRAASGLPFCAEISWNASRVAGVNYDPYRLALHEIGHALGMGIGRSWNDILQVPGGPSPDVHFPGPRAVAAFNAAGGLAYFGRKVPVGQGGAWDQGHWRRGVIDYDVMGGGADCISAITVQALADIGHVVDVSRADPFRLPGICGDGAAAADGADGAVAFEFGDDILRGEPMMVVDSAGKVVRVIRN